MKRIISGGILLISGTVLYTGIRISTVFYAESLGGWSTPPGKFGTALVESGAVLPRNLSVALMIAGVALVLWECFDKQIIKLFTPSS
ncbi:hypothetical protein PUW24_01565 [Paenibacillus urinalis]|uniref:Uncharacterized protein n=1 Tax=Paenibacillus urinalis TaxID=521520 RepID=A0AAX3MVN8_9BACL|nr:MULTISPECIES: hypothetical protein [Paenibacillus]WDH81670.1 hypothetical protein PUW23_19440 [Paenibacillus urinalis]WDH97716.1 hypothetical protein PUW24_01565 [Paenibacillus urinalis]WDI01391.1 hypothetical protein PUW25_19295 [Paenibacillus urinalis]GAK42171.1 hypothetical protein TCA2_4663 [Paenibacillus sp. TCA20]